MQALVSPDTARPGDPSPNGEGALRWPDEAAGEGFSKHVDAQPSATDILRTDETGTPIPANLGWTPDTDPSLFEISVDVPPAEPEETTLSHGDRAHGDGVQGDGVHGDAEIALPIGPTVMRDEPGPDAIPASPSLYTEKVGRGEDVPLTDRRLAEVHRPDVVRDIQPPIVNRDDTPGPTAVATPPAYADRTDVPLSPERPAINWRRGAGGDTQISRPEAAVAGALGSQTANPAAESSVASIPATPNPAATATGEAAPLVAAPKADPAATAEPAKASPTTASDAPEATETAPTRAETSDRATDTRMADTRNSDTSLQDTADLRKSETGTSKTPAGLSASEGPAKAPTATPVLAATPSVVPLSGLSERLVVSLTQANAQAAQSGMPVSMDRLPQTVVAVALTGDRATLQIDPPELGRIQLDYQFDAQGRTVVTLVPETEAARAALAERIATITNALQQSLSGSVDVNVGDMRDFAASDGQAFGRETESGDGSASSNGPSDGRAGTQDPVASARPASNALGHSGSDRLHILV